MGVERRDRAAGGRHVWDKQRQERYEESGECGGVGSSRHGCGGASGVVVAGKTLGRRALCLENVTLRCPQRRSSTRHKISRLLKRERLNLI